MKSDFEGMTIRELQKYVLEHRNDQAAFEALMDRVDAVPQNQVYGEVDAQEFSVLLEQYRHIPKGQDNLS
ncbi:DUF6887 family protein [Roseofilum capinflatum]|uniref:Uncharacterized protein n=1 Tax=Roseofilum capinflatum BLCC-M114 TaxID=3022440 RepID=A0ABT7BCC6_9CYAN|nr:hypothetical protein [Roseofilum capinflatum]MDJ1176166.1 hypothetical protein [Roseofilum capinflatum BLCC-M114]